MLIKLGTMSTPPVKPMLGPGWTQRLPAQVGFELNTQYATIVMMVYRLLILIMILAGLFITAPRPSGLVPDALKPYVRGGGKSTRG